MYRDDIVLKAECYTIIGILFSVYKELGGSFLEKHYQKAVAEAFKKAGIKFTEQVLVKLSFEEKVIGIFYLDFLVEINGSKIVLELKKYQNFGQKNIQQVYNYLRVLKLELGILANFTTSGVKFKRIFNLQKQI